MVVPVARRLRCGLGLTLHFWFAASRYSEANAVQNDMLTSSFWAALRAPLFPSPLSFFLILVFFFLTVVTSNNKFLKIVKRMKMQSKDHNSRIPPPEPSVPSRSYPILTATFTAFTTI